MPSEPSNPKGIESAAVHLDPLHDGVVLLGSQVVFFNDAQPRPDGRKIYHIFEHASDCDYLWEEFANDISEFSDQRHELLRKAKENCFENIQGVLEENGIPLDEWCPPLTKILHKSTEFEGLSDEVSLNENLAKPRPKPAQPRAKPSKPHAKLTQPRAKPTIVSHEKKKVRFNTKLLVPPHNTTKNRKPFRRRLQPILKHRCLECPFSTVYRNNLKQHTFTHSARKKYQCRQCDYQTNIRSLLMFHESSHPPLGGNRRFRVNDNSGLQTANENFAVEGKLSPQVKLETQQTEEQEDSFKVTLNETTLIENIGKDGYSINTGDYLNEATLLENAGKDGYCINTEDSLNEVTLLENGDKEGYSINTGDSLNEATLLENSGKEGYNINTRDTLSDNKCSLKYADDSDAICYSNTTKHMSTAHDTSTKQEQSSIEEINITDDIVISQEGIHQPSETTNEFSLNDNDRPKENKFKFSSMKILRSLSRKRENKNLGEINGKSQSQRGRLLRKESLKEDSLSVNDILKKPKTRCGGFSKNHKHKTHQSSSKTSFSTTNKHCSSSSLLEAPSTIHKHCSSISLIEAPNANHKHCSTSRTSLEAPSANHKHFSTSRSSLETPSANHKLRSSGYSGKPEEYLNHSENYYIPVHGESLLEMKVKRKPGRPRKHKEYLNNPENRKSLLEMKEKRKPGRPRKREEKLNNSQNYIHRKSLLEMKEKRKLGRPRKREEKFNNSENYIHRKSLLEMKKKRKRGRPRKREENLSHSENGKSLLEMKVTRKRGRPRKHEENLNHSKNGKSDGNEERKTQET